MLNRQEIVWIRYCNTGIFQTPQQMDNFGPNGHESQIIVKQCQTETPCAGVTTWTKSIQIGDTETCAMHGAWHRIAMNQRCTSADQRNPHQQHIQFIYVIPTQDAYKTLSIRMTTETSNIVNKFQTGADDRTVMNNMNTTVLSAAWSVNEKGFAIKNADTTFWRGLKTWYSSAVETAETEHNSDQQTNVRTIVYDQNK